MTPAPFLKIIFHKFSWGVFLNQSKQCQKKSKQCQKKSTNQNNARRSSDESHEEVLKSQKKFRRSSEESSSKQCRKKFYHVSAIFSPAITCNFFWQTNFKLSLSPKIYLLYCGYKHFFIDLKKYFWLCHHENSSLLSSHNQA